MYLVCARSVFILRPTPAEYLKPMIYFLLIAGVWAAFLLPPALANRRLSPLSSTEEFSKLTRQLGRARDVSTDSPEVLALQSAAANGVDRGRVLTRRRRILVGLVSLVLVTLLAAIAFGSVQLLLLNLLADAGLIWYIVMLLQIKARQAETTNVVDIRPLDLAGDRPQFRVISGS